MADIIQIRRDTAANWISSNPILAQGELGIELDTSLAKLGDGITDWVTLAYWPVGGGGGVSDHGALTGLEDDDHPQYYNAARGDARYYLKGIIDAALNLKANYEDVVIQNGFENRIDSIMSFVDLTRTFTIQPASVDYSYWNNNIKITETDPQSVVISDLEGLHYIYFDNTNTLVSTQAFNLDDILVTGTFVASIYWDADNNIHIYFGDERHGRMDAEVHKYLHEALHTKWINGLNLGNIISDASGDLDTHAQLAVADGVIRDEDIRYSIVSGSPQVLSTIAQIPLYYKSGLSGSWRMIAATNFPISTTGSGRAAWNEYTGALWQLTESTNNDFVLVHLFATTDVEHPIIGIIGQNNYNSLATAHDGAVNEIHTLIFEGFTTITPEIVPIATVIFQSGDGMTNAVKSKIVTTDNGTDYVDWRLGIGTFIEAGSGVSVGDHGALTGLGDDDHPQYHNDTRGDIRYYTQAVLDALFTALDASKSDIGHTHVKADITDFSDVDYATSAQGALADTALQNITAQSINDLGDVTLGTTNDQDVLTYDIGTGKWISQAPAGGASSAFSGRANLIINPCFQIAQRADSQTTFGVKSMDRWSVDLTGGTLTFSKQTVIADTTIDPNPPTYARVVFDSTGTGVSDRCAILQNIENVQYSSSKNMVLTFWAKADANKDIAVEFYQNFGSGGSATVLAINVTTVSLTTEWQKFTIPVAFPSTDGKTIGTDNRFVVNFWFSAGSDSDARTNSLGNQSGTFEFTNVKLEVGTNASTFHVPPVYDDLRDCQRYCWKGHLPGYGYGALYGPASQNYMALPALSFPVTMRKNPTMTIETAPTYENCSHDTIDAYTDGFIHRVNKSASSGIYRAFAGIYLADAEY